MTRIVTCHLTSIFINASEQLTVLNQKKKIGRGNQIFDLLSVRRSLTFVSILSSFCCEKGTILFFRVHFCYSTQKVLHFYYCAIKLFLDHFLLWACLFCFVCLTWFGLFFFSGFVEKLLFIKGRQKDSCSKYLKNILCFQSIPSLLISNA